MLSSIHNNVIFIKSKIASILNTGSSKNVGDWLFSFSSIIFLRIFIEKISQSFPNDSIGYLATFYLQNFFFFSITFCFLWLWTSFIAKKSLVQLSSYFYWGLWIILLPPILDIIHSGGRVYWSFYLLNDLKDLWKQYYSLFGHLPPAVIYFGTKIVIFLAVIFLSVLVYIKTKNYLKTAINVIVSYSIFFVLASFPSWVSFFYFVIFEKKNIFDINEYHIIGLMASTTKVFSLQHSNMLNALSYKLNLIYYCVLFFLFLIFLWQINKTKLIYLFKNSQFFLLLILLVFLGIGIISGSHKSGSRVDINIFTFFASICIALTLYCLLLITRINLGKNKTNNQTGDLSQIAPILYFFVLTGSFIVAPKLLFFCLAYLILLYIFSQQSFSLFNNVRVAEEFFFVASLIILIFCGFVIGEKNQTLENFPWRVFLVLIFTALSFFEAFKIKSDKFGEITYPHGKIADRRLVASVLFFLLFPTSVYLLNEKRLFLISFIWSSLVFWIFNARIKFFRGKEIWLVTILTIIFASLFLKYIP